MKSVAKSEEKSVHDHNLSGVSLGTIFNRLTVRIALALLVAIPITFLVSRAFYPLLVPGLSKGLAEEIAAEMGQQTPSNFQLLKCISKHDLAWCYVTTSDGNIDPLTRPFAPNLPQYESTSREVEVRGARYYETVLPMEKGQVLHVGMPLEQTLETFVVSPKVLAFSLLEPTRLGTMLSTFFLVSAMLIALLEISVSRPMLKLARSISMLSNSISKAKYLPHSILATGEINEIIMAVREFALLSEASKPAKLKLDEELKQKEERTKRVEALKALATTSPPGGAQQSVPAALTSTSQRLKVSPLLRSFDYEFSSAQSTKMFAEQALGGLVERYPEVINYAAFFKLDRNFQPAICATIGLNDTSVRMLQEVDHREIARGHIANAKSADLGPMLIRRLGFEQLAISNAFRRIIYLPLKHRDEELAAIVLFLEDEEQINADQLRSVERFRDQITNFFHKLIMLEEAEEADWTDQLTGLRNRQFFQELMGHVLERAEESNNSPFSLLLITGDLMDANLQHHGSDVRDRWIQELAKIMRSTLVIKDKLEQHAEPANYLIRFQGDEFGVVLENCDEEKAKLVAEKIRKTVDDNDLWAGGVKHLTVSIGCASFPANGPTLEEVQSRARSALLYTNEQLGPNKVCHASAMPADYKPSRRGSAFSGELGVLDCSGLLQSIASSQKTGLLSVQDDTERQLLISWDRGRLKQAKLDKIAGVPAIVEFVVTFESGTFTFQQRANTTIDGAGEEIIDSLDKCLIEGALAEDHVRSAKRLIPNMELLVRAVPGIENSFRYLKLQEDRDITNEELNAMKAVIRLADGSRSLREVFQGQPETPTYLLWRAAGLLVENRLLQVKKV